ncbi:MAG: hypothetical protein EAZ09_18995 [Oscillatoriales cyanobacterium]|nr:MAG: hypothetical protein EAZ18_17410 [Oscillatoriales cyanobacterium]TAH18104.1 MAG: hypothetical protein EAZ09_18995 [Oscillatoriales cyanobacterium]
MLSRRKKKEGRRKKEGGRRKKEEGRRKKEEGRRKKEGGRRKILPLSSSPISKNRSFDDEQTQAIEIGCCCWIDRICFRCDRELC